MRRSDGPVWRWIERALIAGGVLCLGWVGIARIEQVRYRREARAAVTATTNPMHGSSSTPSAVGRPSGSSAATADGLPPAGPLVGMLRIPRLGYAEAVAEGDDAATLKIAIGHLPDTSVPWRPGNTALAGHRDTLFRSLRNIRVGDALVLDTPHGTFHYRVRDTLIVNPDDVWVLAPAPGHQLTLITCYPFTYIGSAPHRFIVRADSTDDPPSEDEIP